MDAEATRYDSASPRWTAMASVVAVAGTLAAIAWNRGIALRHALHALVDGTASNTGDALPSVVAAQRLATTWHAPIYEDFAQVGASFVYPPFAALPYTITVGADAADTHARIVWLSRIAWVLCLCVVTGLSWSRARGTAFRIGFLLWSALAFHPLLRALELNQASLLVASCLGAGVWLARREHVVAAGACCALAAAFKPYLVVVPLLMLLCSWRFLRGALVTVAIVGAVSLVYGGLHNHLRYLEVVLPRLAVGYSFHPNQSWTALFLRLDGASPLEFALPAAVPWVRTAGLVASATMLVVGGTVLRRFARQPWAMDQLPLAILFAWQIAELASPISWEHHYIPALFVLAWLAREALEGRASRTTVACAALAAPAIAGFVDVRSWSMNPVAVLGMSHVMWGGLLLAVASANHLLDRRPMDVATP